MTYTNLTLKLTIPIVKSGQLDRIREHQYTKAPLHLSRAQPTVLKLTLNYMIGERLTKPNESASIVNGTAICPVPRGRSAGAVTQ